MARKVKTFERGRDVKTGRFLALKDAKRRKKSAVVEVVKKK